MSPDGIVFILVDKTSLSLNMASIQICDVIPAQNCSIRRFLSGYFLFIYRCIMLVFLK